MTFEYGGRAYTMDDIAHDPSWRTSAPRKMHLMDFRMIQTVGAHRCRW